MAYTSSNNRAIHLALTRRGGFLVVNSPNTSRDDELRAKVRRLFTNRTTKQKKFEVIKDTSSRRTIVAPYEHTVDKIMQLIQAEREQAEKSLVTWAFQAEGATEPKFVSEPLAVAHRLVERLKELDPEFAEKMEAAPSNHPEPEQEGKK